MTFLDVDFPLGVASGATGGPERRVDIVGLSSGAEERNALWSASRRRWQAETGVRNAEHIRQILAHWEEVRGQLFSFRFRDWLDFSSASTAGGTPAPTDQTIGTGDGSETTFQLVKAYGSGVNNYSREISKPRQSGPGQTTVRVALDGVEQLTGWTRHPFDRPGGV